MSSALNALSVSMCTSSIMYTLNLPLEGRYMTLSRISRTSSTRLFEAASISTISMLEGSDSAAHTEQRLQGEPSCGSRQLTARANIFATLVLPVPREPQNK